MDEQSHKEGKRTIDNIGSQSLNLILWLIFIPNKLRINFSTNFFILNRWFCLSSWRVKINFILNYLMPKAPLKVLILLLGWVHTWLYFPAEKPDARQPRIRRSICRFVLAFCFLEHNYSVIYFVSQSVALQGKCDFLGCFSR